MTPEIWFCCSVFRNSVHVGPLRRQIYIANIDFDLTEEDILYHLSQCGEIEKLELVVRTSDGQHQGKLQCLSTREGNVYCKGCSSYSSHTTLLTHSHTYVQKDLKIHCCSTWYATFSPPKKSSVHDWNRTRGGDFQDDRRSHDGAFETQQSQIWKEAIGCTRELPST